MAEWLGVSIFDIRSAINAGCDNPQKLKEYTETRKDREDNFGSIDSFPSFINICLALMSFVYVNNENP